MCTLSGSSILESAGQVSITLAVSFNEGYEGDYVFQTIAFDTPNTPNPVQALGTWMARPRAAASGISVTSAATFTEGPIAPGEIVTLFGGRFTTVMPATAHLPLPSYMAAVAGVSVLVNGAASPLFNVSASQINFQVPNDTPPGLARITVRRDGLPDLFVSSDVQVWAPSILRSGVGDYASARNQDGTSPFPASAIDGSAHPSQPGGVLTLYALGLGPTVPAVAAGSPAPIEEPLAGLPVTPSVYFGSSYADATKGLVLFAGLTPGSAGLYQINVQVPAGVRTGEHVPVTLTFDGYTSNTVEVSISTGSAQSRPSAFMVPGSQVRSYYSLRDLQPELPGSIVAVGLVRPKLEQSFYQNSFRDADISSLLLDPEPDIQSVVV